jgi:nucleotide-binding universal stress UspA family protein
MYKHILIPTDGSELSQKAIDHGAKLAKALNAKVTAVTVSEPFHIFSVESSMVTDTPEERSCPMNPGAELQASSIG